LFTGATVVLLCLLHGASFLALKTAGEVRRRSLRAGRRVAPLAAAAVLGFAVWTQFLAGNGVAPLLVEAVAVVTAVAAAWLLGRGRDGRAFAATSVAMAAVVVSSSSTPSGVMVSTLARRLT
jgi:cytochrome d ubiquinol oxidase subunit II